MERLAADPKCPRCGELLNGYEAVDGWQEPPVPGDFSVCAACGSPLRFTTGLGLRLMERKDLKDLSGFAGEQMTKLYEASERRQSRMN